MTKRNRTDQAELTEPMSSVAAAPAKSPVRYDPTPALIRMAIGAAIVVVLAVALAIVIRPTGSDGTAATHGLGLVSLYFSN